MAQIRRLVRGGAHADPAGQHEGRQEAEAEHADQPFIVLSALAQATGVADADGGQVIVDLLAGQASTGISDAQHAGTGINLHRNARRHVNAGLLDAAADDRVMRVLYQLTQRHHRVEYRCLPSTVISPLRSTPARRISALGVVSAVSCM